MCSALFGRRDNFVYRRFDAFAVVVGAVISLGGVLIYSGGGRLPLDVAPDLIRRETGLLGRRFGGASVLSGRGKLLL